MAKAGTKELKLEVSQAVRAIGQLNKAIDGHIAKVKESVTAQKASNALAASTAATISKVATAYDKQKTAIVGMTSVIRTHTASVKNDARTLDNHATKLNTSNTLLRTINAAYRQHINTLALVQSKTQQLANTRTSSINAHIRETAEINKTNVAMGGLRTVIGDIVAKMNQKNSALQKQTQATNADAAAATNLGQRWNIIVALFTSHAVHRSLSLLSNEIRTSLDTYRQLSMRIAEIETIQGKVGFSTEQWQSKLAALSSEFGIPVLETAKGVYEAISNQVIEAGNATSFMREEMKLAITTNGSLANAVNATSSVLKAWNLDTSHSDIINAKLFKTIDLGRITLDEFSSGFGRLSVQSSLLGASFDEQEAAITTLTRKGVAADVTLTLLQNVMNKLAQPTKTMTANFEEWGVASGTAAIKAFGLEGVLKKLFVKAAEGGDALGDLSDDFKDIRAILGAAGLVTSLDDFANDLAEIKNSVRDFGNAVDITMNATGRKVTITFEEMRNAIINRFGEPVSRFFLQFVSMFYNGTTAANTLIDTLRALVIVGGSWRLAVIAVDMATRAYNITLTATQIRQAAVTLGITLLIAAVVEGAIRFNNYAHSFDELSDAIEANAVIVKDKILADYIQELNIKMLASIDTFEKHGRTLGAWAAGINAKNNAIAASFDKTFKDIGKSIKDGLTDPLKEVDARIKDEEKAIEKLRRDAEKSVSKVADLKLDERDRAVDKAVETAPDEKAAFKLLEDEKTRLHKEAAAARVAGDDELAEELFQRAIRRAEEQEKFVEKARDDAKRLAAKDEDGGAEAVAAIEKDAAKLLLKLETDRLAIVNARIAAEDAAAKKAIADAAVREAALEAQKKAFKELQDILAELDTAVGGKKNPADGARIAELLKKAGGFAAAAGLDPREQLLLFREAKAAEVEVHKAAEVQKTKDIIEEAQKRIEAAVDQFKKTALAKAAAEKKATNIAKDVSASGDGKFGALGKFVGDFRAGGDIQHLDRLKQAILSVQSAAALLGKDATSIRLYEDALKHLESVLKSTPLEKFGFGFGKGVTDEKGRLELPDVGNADDIIKGELKKLEALKAAAAEADKQFDTQLKQERLQREVERQQAKIIEKHGQIGEAAVKGGAIANESIDQQIRKLRELMDALDAVARKQGGLGGLGAGEVKLPGFAFGGQARGIDRIHALLADGETVMTQWASRQFAPYLAAMNHGPALSNISNTNFGDIHIHAPAGSTEVQMQAIASGLQRLNRRGQFSLR